MEEVQDSSESIADIQNYLNDFGKDIQPKKKQRGEMQDVKIRAVSQDSASGQETTTYIVDQNGQYIALPSDEGQGSDDEEGKTAEIVIGDPLPSTSFVTVQPSTSSENLDVQAETSEGSGNQDNQVLLGTGNDNYQTVTLVASEGNPNELSYVLIVQQPEEGESEGMEGNQDMTVYDFNEGEEMPEEGDGATSEVEDDKSKVFKLIPKKSQTVTQAHMCNYCNYVSPKRYLLSRHMKSHSEERPHKCSVCERGFKTLASLQNHVNTHTGIKPHPCKYCEASFTTSGELVRHIRYRHTMEKPHKCPTCDYSSVELSKLKRHIRAHTGERPYQCPHCTYASPDTFKLKRHLRIHTGEKPYECDVCHARFTQSNSLKAHRLIHTAGDKPVFQCELCPATCGRKTDLRIHVQKLHTSDRPLKCKRCGKSFPDRYSFKLHTKTHEGEKCFKCELCPYASVSQRHLESHMLVHTDQKPFHCDRCGQNFRQKQLLKRHMNLYHNPQYIPPAPKEKSHQCPECKRMFRHKGNLIRHMSLHDPESSAQEKALALRMGRQKRIMESSGMQLSGEGLVSVQGGDGQQYVVLEVIQVQDSEGNDQTLAVVADKPLASGQSQRSDTPMDQEEEDEDEDNEHEDLMSGEDSLGDSLISGDVSSLSDSMSEGMGKQERHLSSAAVESNLALRREDQDTKKDMENCFGFDEEEEDEDEDEDEDALGAGEDL